MKRHSCGRTPEDVSVSGEEELLTPELEVWQVKSELSRMLVMSGGR